MGWLISFVVAWLLAALVIFIVGRLGLGMTVDGFVPALIAAAVIAIVATAVNWLLGLVGITTGNPGFWGALVSLVVAAVVLLISDRFVKGMKVNGFVGALVAAVAIGVVGFLANWVAGLF